MALWLLIISLFVKAYIPIAAKSIDYLSRFPIYVALLTIIIYYILGIKPKKTELFDKKICISIVIIMVFQFVAMCVSYKVIGHDPTNRNPLKQSIILFVFIGCIFIHYYAVKFTISSRRNIDRFIQGNFIALMIMLLVSYLQFFYLIFPTHLAEIMSFIGRYFENRAERYWYYNGSYVQTIHKINGLVSEAGFFASKMLIVFVPFILGSIKNKTNLFFKGQTYKNYVFIMLLLSIIFILFASKSTTGMLAVMIIILSLWANLSAKKKVVSVLFVVILAALFFLIYPKDGPVYGILNDTLFHKSNTESSINRSAGTIALILVWLKHFFLGVGYNFQVYYLFENVPKWATTNNEYINTFVPKHYYPILSIFIGWLAQFGLLCVGILMSYVYKLLKDLRVLSKKASTLNISNNDSKRIEGIKDAAHYFVIFYLVVSLFSFDWADSIYLFMFFFFVVYRQILRKYIAKESFNVDTKERSTNI